MRHSIRAPVIWRWTLAAVLVCSFAAGGGDGAQNAATTNVTNGAVSTGEPIGETYRRVKTFDFNEQPLGNFEDTPMYWRKFTGPGLPFYSTGEFDHEVGHEGLPSFRFTLKGGNIGWEYFRDDLVISPESDYLIAAYARAQGLEHSQAFFVAYLLDELGEVIPGSYHVSDPLRCTAGADTDWQRLTLRLQGNPPQARVLRLQLWLLQDYVWQEPTQDLRDPIIRQDVEGRVWFDDLAVYRMPRIQLRLSNPGGIIAPGANEELMINVHNATLAPLATTLTVRAASGVEILHEAYDIPAVTTRDIRVPVPSLTPGLYEARVRLGTDQEALLKRRIRFAVLPDLPRPEARYDDLGLDLGRWRGGDVEGAVELVTTLRCGGAKIGETVGSPEDKGHTDYLGQIRDLARQFVINTIETTGVILPPESGGDTKAMRSTLDLMRSDTAWDQEAGPGFAYLGDLVFSWQLGSEAVELSDPDGWSIRTIEKVRYKLERFVAVPSLVVPRSVFDSTPTKLLPELMTGVEAEEDPEPPVPAVDWDRTSQPRIFTGRPLADPALPHAYTFWVPADLPAEALPWQLAFWFEPATDRDFEAAAEIPRNANMRDPEHWLSLGLDQRPETPTAERVADAARRIALAKAVNPDRLYAPAPFELVDTGGVPTWQPTDLYIPLRTLFNYLSGRRAVAALRLEQNSVAVLFSRGDQSSLIIWTWQVESGPAAVDLYVGRRAHGIQLDGQPLALQFDGPRATIPLSPTPVIIEDVDAPLLLLQHSFDIRPRFIQLHDPEPRPVLTLRNVYGSELTGTIELRPPESWQVTPNPIQVQLGRGEGLAETLYFTIPPRQIATEEMIGVDIRVRRPEEVDLRFDVPVRVELRDILVKTAAWWDADTLVVEQSMRNLSQEAVSFSAFCQAPGHAQREGAFLDVPPGEFRVQVYRYPQARALAGARLWTGIEEIDGRRSLDQVVDVPP